MVSKSAVVVRYQEHVAATFIAVPLIRKGAGTAQLAGWDRAHFIDHLVAEKWERLHLSPSPPADDATFHRRAYLDLIGKLPTPAEVTSFLADQVADSALSSSMPCSRARNMPTAGHSNGPQCPRGSAAV